MTSRSSELELYDWSKDGDAIQNGQGVEFNRQNGQGVELSRQMAGKIVRRETYKIERNLVLDGVEEFCSSVMTNCELITYGIAITPPHRDGFQEARTNVIVSIFDEQSNLLSRSMDVVKVISDYEVPHLVNLANGIKFNASTTYKISVKYVCDSDLNKLELLCFYLSPTINTHANSLTVQFEDQLYGGVVRGISFYVL
ncbi:hypothetical protein FQA39_LY05106 [Lamprigera yunnana]|nr:hypothetical protein FQA39_LY05106 [Lamprigera yunnana]